MRTISRTRSTPVDPLGDRVLDLEARVHLEEVEAAVLREEELEGAAPSGSRRPSRPARRPRPSRRRARAIADGARRLLDDLLVAALDRAVALEEVDHVAVAIAEHLDLDVARPEDRLLEVDGVVAEGASCASLRARSQALRHLGLAVDEAHALAAAARTPP